MSESSLSAPTPLKIVVGILFIFGLFAFVAGVTLYGMGFILTPPPDADLSYPVADTLVNGPACVLAAIGLWRLRKWGYALGWFVAGFYIYASVEIFAAFLHAGPPYLPEIFVPQTLAVLLALALMRVMWRHRDAFR